MFRSCEAIYLPSREETSRKIWIRKDIFLPSSWLQEPTTRDWNVPQTRKIWIRKDIFQGLHSLKELTTSNWHIPQDLERKKETEPHVGQLLTESIPFGRSENTALDSRGELGYNGDFEDTESEGEVSSPKKIKYYYVGKIGGPVISSPSYLYYTPASPSYSPIGTSDTEEVWPTFTYNPFKSDGDTDDEYSHESNLLGLSLLEMIVSDIQAEFDDLSSD